MRIAFFVNDIRTEKSTYTTTSLAINAHNMGHEVWYIGAEDFALDPDDSVRARARSAPKRKYVSTKVYLEDILGPKAKAERISVDDLDVLFLRSDPAEDNGPLEWRRNVGILFGRIATARGVIVLNDPTGLSKAMNKMYFQLFPEEVRPVTLISRDRRDIRAFAREFKHIVLKPVMGSGGKNVFLVRPDDLPNLNQMIDAISRDGYIVAQEYLKEAEQGDIRLFLVNGLPFRHKGKYAAFRRVRADEDLRSNISAGGKYAPAEIGETELRVADIVRPKIVLDGMFMVGLDIVGTKLMEINVFSPGGLPNARKLEGVNFSRQVINMVHSKVDYVKLYDRKFDNIELATL